MTAGLRGAKSASHVVDELIAERAPSLSSSPAWPLLRPLLHGVLGYRKACAMAQAVAPMSGQEALDYVSSLLRLKVDCIGLKRVPRRGRLIVVINHPTGLADGVAVYDGLRRVRPDLQFFANADALRVNPRLSEVIIPVEWVPAKRTRAGAREVLERAAGAMDAERALVISPAGRIAREAERGLLIDPPWQTSAVALARRHDAPILPVHVSGPSSTLFRLFNRLSPELRDITLFHEMLNKTGGRFTLTFGVPIPPDAVAADAATFTERLKTYVERILPVHPERPFA